MQPKQNTQSKLFTWKLAILLANSISIPFYVTLLLLMFQQDCLELKEKKKKKTACQTDLFPRKARIVQILQGLFIFIRGEVRGGEERQIPLKLILALLQIVSFNQTQFVTIPPLPLLLSLESNKTILFWLDKRIEGGPLWGVFPC